LIWGFFWGFLDLGALWVGLELVAVDAVLG
jgi:hypothetical protein